MELIKSTFNYIKADCLNLAFFLGCHIKESAKKEDIHHEMERLKPKTFENQGLVGNWIRGRSH